MKTLVVHPSDMDDETFIKHMNLRHLGDMNLQGPMRYSPLDTYYGALRAFHKRIHDPDITSINDRPVDHDHEHEGLDYVGSMAE